MHEDHEQPHRDGRIPDELWEHIVPLLPPRKPHPLGCHRPRVDARKALEAICFVLRTGCQWHALHETGSCASSAAHRRVHEWTAAAVFLTLWKQGLVADDALQGMAWEGLARDGARTTAPLGGENGGPQPDRPGPARHQAPRAHRRRWGAGRPRRGRGESPRCYEGAGDQREEPHRTTGAAPRQTAGDGPGPRLRR